jgi:hypothetical protein
MVLHENVTAVNIGLCALCDEECNLLTSDSN